MMGLNDLAFQATVIEQLRSNVKQYNLTGRVYDVRAGRGEGGQDNDDEE